MDSLSIIGLVVGIGAILVGQQLEGGHISSLLNGPATLIVLGGSLGAVMLQSPVATFVRAMQLIPWIVRPPVHPLGETIDKIVSWSQVARREGLLGLENTSEGEPDTFDDVAVALTVPTDHRAILTATREIPYGSQTTVEGLVGMAGLDPEDEDAVEEARTALAENPVPLIIPDHRVRDGPSAAPPEVEQRLRSLEGL